jgi:predicted transglutaminase-like cysteine proteinase
MTHLRAMPYQYSIQWKTPAEVGSALAADCKGKAVILYAKMRAMGATHVRFVIGKHRLADLKTHAWLEWDTTKGTFLLDPTFKSTVERATQREPGTYIPLYAFNGARKYRANYYSSSYAPVVASN